MSPKLRKHVCTIPIAPHPLPRIEYGAGSDLPLEGGGG
jgi:hypothetical protein